MTLHTPNFWKAHELLKWLKSQYAVSPPEQHDDIAAAAIAAHLNAKDVTIERLIWERDDLGYPRGQQ